MELKVYRAVHGSPISDGDAEVLGRRFDSLATELGAVTPEDIVQDAESPESPTHPYFEWDDAEAGRRYRVTQAREYLRFITVEITGQSEPVRAFHPVTIVREEQTDKDTAVQTSQRGYVPLEIVVSKPELWEQVVDQARKELLSTQRKLRLYKNLQQIADGPIQIAIEALAGLSNSGGGA